MDYALKYGQGSYSISIPQAYAPEILTPGEAASLTNVEAGIRSALSTPLAAAPLHARPHPKRVAIAVPDETRPVPLKRLLPPLLETLQAAFPALSREDIAVVVGGGLHPPPGEDALERTLPLDALRGCQIQTHDSERSELADLGRTSRGTPVLVNAGFCQADLKLVVGQIDPHQFVGFTGGSKGAVIGLGGYATIEHNHSLLFQEGALPGRLDGNPVREDQNEAGRLIGIDLALNVVLNARHEIADIIFGSPDAVLERGASTCADVYGVSLEQPYDLIVASCGGYPKDISLYQAQKGLNLASQALKPQGGRILLLAACEQGVGDPRYYEFTCSFSCIEEAMRGFQGQDFAMGAHKCYLFGITLTQHDAVIHSELDSDTLAHCHLKPGNAQETIDAWLASAPKDTRIGIVPNANTTYFERSSGQGPQPQG